MNQIFVRKLALPDEISESIRNTDVKTELLISEKNNEMCIGFSQWSSL